jgi:tetratricopeptide (TPR) repeat protein
MAMIVSGNSTNINNIHAGRQGIRIFLMTVFSVLSILSFGQKENKLLRNGNRQYEAGKYKDAEMSYRKALELNKESEKGQFNLGDATYKQKNFEESSKIFNNLAESKADANMKAKAYHNLGNSLLEGKKYEESIQAFKNSLLNQPSDVDTKYNLEYARMMLQKQQQQQKQKQDQQKKDDKDKDKKKQDQKQNQDKQDQKQDKKDQQPEQKKISKEDAERLLEALKNDERKTLQKVKKQKVKGAPINIEKQW